VTDAKLRRTVRRCVAILLLPLSVAADALRRIVTEEFFLGSVPLGGVVTPVLFYGALAYLLGSALAGLPDPAVEESEGDGTDDGSETEAADDGSETEAAEGGATDGPSASEAGN
jgi:hypothetical protein